MKRLIGLMALLFGGIVAWRILDNLSSDAIGMGIGVIFGVMAGIPMVLLLLAADRRRNERREPRSAEFGMSHPHYAPQPPVIIMTAPTHGQPGNWPPAHPALEAPAASEWENTPPARRYRIVGEQEEWTNE